MTSVLLLAFSVIGVGAILGSFVATFVRYRSLPATVPVSFDSSGLPRAYGPRPAIFFMVGIQAFTLVVEAFVVSQTGSRPGGAVAAVLAAGVIAAISVLLTCLQLQTLAIALGTRTRTTNPIVFIVVVSVVAAAGVVIGSVYRS